MNHPTQLPEGFRLGTATASFQIEGARHEGGKSDSIWDTFSGVPGAVMGGHNGDVACDHYHRYPDDVNLMRELNLDTYRFSISWPRVAPDGARLETRGMDFYSRLTDSLLEAGIEPWVTLYHWDLPQALEDQGGWRSRTTAHRFAEYSRLVFEHLCDRVRVWTTLNEPWCSAFLGHASGEHAPGRRDAREAMHAAHHLNLAHGLAVGELRAAGCTVQNGFQLGLTINPTVFWPEDPASEADRRAAARYDALRNRLWLDPVFRGEYPLGLLGERERAALEEVIHGRDMAVISRPIEVLGVNFYNGEQVRALAEPVSEAEGSAYPGTADIAVSSRGLPRTAMGWEVEADDFRILLERLHNEYTAAASSHLVVTENGAAYDDEPDETGYVDDTDTRLAYIRSHLQAVLQAVNNGADVRGYLAWSLLDNFEWAWGYTRRFGIVRVDFETQERTPKASARWLAEVARTRDLVEPGAGSALTPQGATAD